MMSDGSENPPTAHSVDEFLRWVEEWVSRRKGARVFYRGLSNEKYDVSASIVRRLRDKPGDKISHQKFLEAVQRLLGEAEMLGHRESRKYSREMRELELLAELQHFGAATCLIDFTLMPLIALWFAASGEAETGRVVAVSFDDNGDKKVSPINIKNDIKFFLEQEGGGAPVDGFWVWDELRHQNSRITAQHSAFVFGPAVLTVPDENTCFIANKREILEELERLGISKNRLFCDFEGFARCNSQNVKYPDWTAEDYFDFGQENYAAGKYERAAYYYTLALGIDENNAEVYFNRAYAKFRLDKYKDAIEDFSRTIMLNKNNAVAYFARGTAKSLLYGDAESAIQDFDRAIALDRNYAEAYFMRGSIKSRLGKYKNAVEDFSRGIAIKDNDAAAYYLRAAAKYQSGDKAGARSDFETAQGLDPERFPFPAERFKEGKK